MPRKREGTIEWSVDHYKVRITLPDGRRPWVHLEAGHTEEMARERARSLSELAARDALPGFTRVRGVKGVVETVREWSKRWLASRDALASVGDDLSRLNNHILDAKVRKRRVAFGDLAMPDVRRDDIEDIVSALDLRVRAGEISWKTAKLVWSNLSKMFDDATNAKDRALRVLTSSPASGVRGPNKGAEKGHTYLYPDEFLKLVSCEAVPLRWRRLFTLAVYIFGRANELDELHWSDIDLDHGTISIARSRDRLRNVGTVNCTKGKRTRRNPLEQEVVPLLAAMRAEADGKGPVFATRTSTNLASRLRKYLRTAGVTRNELLKGDPQRNALRFHDLRATGITWMAVRGDDTLRIQHRAGHHQFSTTGQHYIREAENVSRSFGTPFPPLPRSLMGASAGSAASGSDVAPTVESSGETSGRAAFYADLAEIAARMAVGITGFETRCCRRGPESLGRSRDRRGRSSRFDDGRSRTWNLPGQARGQPRERPRGAPSRGRRAARRGACRRCPGRPRDAADGRAREGPNRSAEALRNLGRAGGRAGLPRYARDEGA